MTISKRISIIPCSKVLRHIQTELETGLNLQVYQRMRKHLENCPNCMCYLDSLKKVVYLYRNLPEFYPGMILHKKLRTTLNGKMRSHQPYKENEY
jgi:hypothetical protein